MPSQPLPPAAVEATQDDTCGTSAPSEPSNTPGKRSNLIVRHWRGDLSLGVSYWLFGSALTLAIVLASTSFDTWLSAQAQGMHTAGALMIVTIVTLTAVAVWQCVGIWHSALKHVSRGRQRKWATLACAAVVLGAIRISFESVTVSAPMAYEGLRLLVGIDDIPEYSIVLSEDRTTVYLNGGIRYGSFSALRAALDEAPGVTTLALSSSGGRLSEALRLNELVMQRGLNTVSMRECSSACTIVYLAGRTRTISPYAYLGFHRASLNGKSGAHTRSADGEFHRAMRKAGIPQSFIVKALSTPPDRMWYPSHMELLVANVITAYPESTPKD